MKGKLIMNNKPDPGIFKNKYFLYITEFFAGMSVMAVELGASRLLAPYFSSSQIVWTIIIGTIMIAMALGNIFGGRSADKNPDPDKLYRRMLIAAVWIAAIPAVGKYIIVGISGLLVITIDTGFLTIAAFVSCMIIFVFPLFLLGTVTPSLVKYTTDNLDDNGKVVGTLGAFNTIGSIIGTFLPTFLTIPAVGTAITFLLFSGVLLVIGLIYFISEKRHIVAMIISAVLFVLFSVFGNSDSFAFWESDLAYEGESVYNYLQVRDLEDRTILSTNVLFGVQSVSMKKNGLTGMYYDYAMSAPVMASSSKSDGKLRILVLGNGTGTFAKQCREYFSDASPEITGVEIDEAITELSGRFFNPDKKTNVTTYDGRAYIKADQGTYDVIMVDAYQDITIPFSMSSIEFFREVYDHLTDDGVMVVNLNMRSEQGSESNDDPGINTWLCDTIASVYGDVATVDVPGTTNRELFAMKRPGDIKRALESGLEKISQEDLKTLMASVGESMVMYRGGGNIFTDDRSPVELLGMRQIDSIIKQELVYYKDVFKEKGFAGLIESF